MILSLFGSAQGACSIVLLASFWANDFVQFDPVCISLNMTLSSSSLTPFRVFDVRRIRVNFSKSSGLESPIFRSLCSIPRRHSADQRRDHLHRPVDEFYALLIPLLDGIILIQRGGLQMQ